MGKCDFSFLAVLLGKRPQNGPKNAIFKNWPKIRPKVINAWIKCLVYHFGGCFAGFLESVLRFGRPKCHFLALKNGHFWRKCPFSSAKKWHFGRPNLRTDSKNPAKHPQKWWNRYLIHAFITFEWVLSQFWEIVFFRPF